MSESEAFEFSESAPEFKRVLELASEFMASINKTYICNGTEGDYLETAFEDFVCFNHPDVYDKVKRDSAIYMNALQDWQVFVDS